MVFVVRAAHTEIICPRVRVVLAIPHHRHDIGRYFHALPFSARRRLLTPFACGHPTKVSSRRFFSASMALPSLPVNGMSLVHGPTDTSRLSDLSIPALLQHTTRSHADRECVVFAESGIRWTWSQFSTHVDIAAAGLLQLGVCKGDRVGIWCPNRSEWLVLQFASARIGAILVHFSCPALLGIKVCVYVCVCVT